MNILRTEEYKKGEYSRAGGCVPLPVPDDLPFFVKDYSEYYKGRGYHERSLNSNEGWNSIGCQSFMNQPILKYSNEIRSAVLIMHGEKAHSYYFGKDAYEAMIKNSKYVANKELLTIPDAVHTDLYDSLDEGWVDCFGKAKLKGLVTGGGISAPNEAGSHKNAMQKAYELGKRL